MDPAKKPSGENIYRTCRIRGGFKSQEQASSALNEAGHQISSASLKDYERNARVPSAENVMALAKVYGTPELKWMHCSNSCTLGKSMLSANPAIGLEDVYRTYFELTGAFNKISDIENRLHDIIADDALTDDELPALDDILAILDRINESTKELRIWAEKHRKISDDMQADVGSRATLANAARNHLQEK